MHGGEEKIVHISWMGNLKDRRHSVKRIIILKLTCRKSDGCRLDSTDSGLEYVSCIGADSNELSNSVKRRKFLVELRNYYLLKESN
jgi:transcriptional regulator with GAF, ATPase, and Fis domain